MIVAIIPLLIAGIVVMMHFGLIYGKLGLFGDRNTLGELFTIGFRGMLMLGSLTFIFSPVMWLVCLIIIWLVVEFVNYYGITLKEKWESSYICYHCGQCFPKSSS